MLFHKQSNRTIQSDIAAGASPFALAQLEELVYPHRKSSIKRLINPEFAGERFIPDVLASIMQSLYTEGYMERQAIKMALLSCQAHLMNTGYQFKGYLVKDSEVFDEEIKHPFIASTFSDKPGGKPYPIPKDLGPDTLYKGFIKGLEHSKEDIPTFVFIAGCQNSSMLNYRIKKAALLSATLIRQARGTQGQLPWIFLSGGNNADGTGAKVHYPDESRHMKNLIIIGLQRAGVHVDEALYQKLDVDTESTNSKENILNFINYLSKILEEIGSSRRARVRIVIASSTFHLLQLHDAFSSQIERVGAICPETVFDTYLLGTENPGHFFRTHDAAYVKLLFHEVFFRGRQGLLKL